MSANLSKIVNLLKKTGDKAIILDENGDPSYVIMTLGDYEQLILGKSEVRGLTEYELLDKINHDIAIWKDSQKMQDLPVDQYDFSKEIEDFDDNYPDFSAGDYMLGDNAGQSLADIYSGNPENQSKKEEIAVPEEDRYYFEPLES